jgi:hypothetical protein
MISSGPQVTGALAIAVPSIPSTKYYLVSNPAQQIRWETYRERRHAVHELPESGQHIVRDQDAIKDECEREEELSNVAGSLGQLHTGNDHERKGGSELSSVLILRKSP